MGSKIRGLPWVLLLIILSGCSGRRHAAMGELFPKSGVAEADSLFRAIERIDLKRDSTLSQTKRLRAEFCSVASLHPDNEILKMRLLYVKARTLMRTDIPQSEALLREGMAKLDSAASPFDWFMLRTINLNNEKSLFERYRRASENVDFFASVNSPLGLARNYEALGTTFSLMQENDKANEYLDKAKEQYSKLDASYYLNSVELNKAIASEPEKQADMLRKLLADSAVRSNPSLHSKVLLSANIAFDSAEYADKAIKIIEDNDIDREDMPLLLTVKTYDMLAQDDVQGALSMLPLIRKECADNKIAASNREFIHSVMSYVYYMSDMKDSCIEEQNRMIEWADSAKREANMPEVYARETKKLLSATEANASLQRQRIVMWWAVSLLAVGVIGICILFMVRRKKMQLRNEIRRLDDEIEAAGRVQLAQSSMMEQSESMIGRIEEIIKNASAEGTCDARITSQISKVLGLYRSEEENRQGFLKINRELDNRFSDRLKRDFPELSESQVRLAALIATGADSHQLASILNISAKSVYTSRYRLRTRLGLTKEDSLEDFLRRYATTD